MSLIGYRGAAEYPPSQEKVNFHFLLFFCRKLELNGKIHSKHTIIYYKWKASVMIENLSRINIHTLILQYYNCKLFDFALIKVHMWVHVKSDGSALLLLCSKTGSYLLCRGRVKYLIKQSSIQNDKSYFTGIFHLKKCQKLKWPTTAIEAFHSPALPKSGSLALFQIELHREEEKCCCTELSTLFHCHEHNCTLNTTTTTSSDKSISTLAGICSMPSPSVINPSKQTTESWL